MDASIVILSYKNSGLIKQQLSHYYSHTDAPRYEIIVVDNNSSDTIGEMLASLFPQVRFIASKENRGYAAGNNLGIRASTGRYVVIVNPDIVFTPSDIGTLIAFMDTHERVGIAGPKLINADGSLQYSCVRFPDIWLPLFRRTWFSDTKIGKRWLARYFMQEWGHAESRDVDWLFGACLIVRRSALEKVGVLDERFFLYLEDTDWCRRFWEHGYEVYYVPLVSLIHLHRRSSDSAILTSLFHRTTKAHLRSFMKYLWKYRGKTNPHRQRKLA